MRNYLPQTTASSLVLKCVVSFFYLSVYALTQLSKRGVVPVLSDNLINYLASSWNLAKFVLFIDFVEPMHILYTLFFQHNVTKLPVVPGSHRQQ